MCWIFPAVECNVGNTVNLGLWVARRELCWRNTVLTVAFECTTAVFLTPIYSFTGRSHSLPSQVSSIALISFSFPSQKWGLWVQLAWLVYFASGSIVSGIQQGLISPTYSLSLNQLEIKMIKIHSKFANFCYQNFVQTSATVKAEGLS